MFHAGVMGTEGKVIKLDEIITEWQDLDSNLCFYVK
jgi:hypothetical protein